VKTINNLYKGGIMFGYEDLMASEQQVYNIVSVRLKGFHEVGPKFVDLCFYLQQSFGEFDDVATPNGELQLIAYMHYTQLPYTVNLIYEQIMTGYYLESQILMRHLFETLLQLKYFYNHPEEIKAHMKHNIQIKKMVDDITKKPLYKYYRQLCSYAHGFLMKDIHRTDRKINRTYLGNIYNEDICTVPINYLFQLVLGFINVYDNIFKKSIIENNVEAHELKEYIRNFCISAIESHIKVNPGSKEWYDAMSDLIF
jgi:hypothetical protein